MEKKFFPIFVDISEKKIVIIGGGSIATRRVKTLLEFCENITVVAPVVTKSLEELAAQGKITWICENYHIPHIWDANMVIAATNQPDVNLEIRNDILRAEKETGKARYFNSIDEKERCNFYFPSIVQTEDVVVGINSGGKSPKQTKYVREQVEKLLDSNSIYE